MNLLAVDIGNTSTTIGAFVSDVLATQFHFPTRTLTHRELTHSAVEQPLKSVAPPNIIGIASVVPWASDELIVVLHEIYPAATILVVTSSNFPMSIDYPNVDELGTDRLLGALAAYERWGQRDHRPCIVIDMGTATTYDCVTSSGTYLGGAIAPGLELGAQALAERAAQLPSIDVSFPASIIGRTTVESIQSGIVFGALAQLEGLVARFREFAFPGEQPVVVVTGGLSRLMEGRSHSIDHIEPQLVLEGIRIAAERIATQSIDETGTTHHTSA